MMKQQLCANCMLYFLLSVQDSRQINLLIELLDLQKDMVVFLLSMLEGKFKLLLSSLPVVNKSEAII